MESRISFGNFCVCKEDVSNFVNAKFGVYIEISDWLICFDDLERCGLPINEILGYINSLVEHNMCKVIILANEEEIGTVTLHQRLEEKYQEED